VTKPKRKLISILCFLICAELQFKNGEILRLLLEAEYCGLNTVYELPRPSECAMQFPSHVISVVYVVHVTK